MIIFFILTVIGTTPLEEPRKSSVNLSFFNNHHTIVANPILSSSAPYTVGAPDAEVVTRTVHTKSTVQQASSKPKSPENIEMSARPNAKPTSNPSRSQPSSEPKKVTNLDDRGGKRRAATPPTNEETETSYF